MENTPKKGPGSRRLEQILELLAEIEGTSEEQRVKQVEARAQGYRLGVTHAKAAIEQALAPLLAAEPPAEAELGELPPEKPVPAPEPPPHEETGGDEAGGVAARAVPEPEPAPEPEQQPEPTPAAPADDRELALSDEELRALLIRGGFMASRAVPGGDAFEIMRVILTNGRAGLRLHEAIDLASSRVARWQTHPKDKVLHVLRLNNLLRFDTMTRKFYPKKAYRYLLERAGAPAPAAEASEPRAPVRKRERDVSASARDQAAVAAYVRTKPNGVGHSQIMREVKPTPRNAWIPYGAAAKGLIRHDKKRALFFPAETGADHDDES